MIKRKTFWGMCRTYEWPTLEELKPVCKKIEEWRVDNDIALSSISDLELCLFAPSKGVFYVKVMREIPAARSA